MNSFFLGCPARMDDGRFITDYRTASVREYSIRRAAARVVPGLTEDEYRGLRQRAAKRIIDGERMRDMRNNSCADQHVSCIHSYEQSETRTTDDKLHAKMMKWNRMQAGIIDSSDGYPVCYDPAMMY